MNWKPASIWDEKNHHGLLCIASVQGCWSLCPQKMRSQVSRALKLFRHLLGILYVHTAPAHLLHHTKKCTVWDQPKFMAPLFIVKLLIKPNYVWVQEDQSASSLVGTPVNQFLTGPRRPMGVDQTHAHHTRVPDSNPCTSVIESSSQLHEMLQHLKQKVRISL